MPPVENGGPAYPSGSYADGYRQDGSAVYLARYEGMSLRDYFAAKALVGLLSAYSEQDPSIYARDAYTVADAMLKARGT